MCSRRKTAKTNAITLVPFAWVTERRDTSSMKSEQVESSKVYVHIERHNMGRAIGPFAAPQTWRRGC
jgi:hypothetical protein